MRKIYELGWKWAQICGFIGWVLWGIINIVLLLVFMLPSIPYGLIKKDWRTSNMILDVATLIIMMPLKLMKIERIPNYLNAPDYGEYMDLAQITEEHKSALKEYWTGE